MSDKQAITGCPRGTLPFAPEGSFIITLLVLTVGAALLCWWIAAAVLFGLLLFNINRFEMQTDSGEKIAFTQISGLVARRIVSYSSVGDRVEAGQRIGMIRFGSRVNCEIPAGFELCVKVGGHVTAGKTIIARKVEAA
jgi:hypothetical protein